MKNYLTHDPWQIIEHGFHPEHQRISESIFSLGNGRMGQRGNFEEHYSGDTLQGNYFAGIYYPDKTKVGWWKIGYPEYFAKVLNAVKWPGLDIYVNDARLDLHTMPPQDFVRVLDMRHGLLQRSFNVRTSGGTLQLSFERFCAMHEPDLGAVRLRIQSIDFTGDIRVHCYLKSNVRNEDANWDEVFWDQIHAHATEEMACTGARTRKTDFVVFSAATWSLTVATPSEVTSNMGEGYAESVVRWNTKAGDEHTFDKFVAHSTSMYHPVDSLQQRCEDAAQMALTTGYDRLRTDHIEAWRRRWNTADIVIEGDISAQQATRFCIFHLLQTYTGDDPRLNIGPKGFTGEKYGGSTYWDTEAYCLPFYLGTCPPAVARQLLTYRYRHLEKAIENAQKLGFTAGAALYPMVTMTGEECHNEWEITFEEIHRNGAIAYAIFDYIRYTGDVGYLLDGGLEVLIAIARFWSQRVSWSAPKQQYVILGVTGPNEYENNVDNNWYTNYIARWCMQYAAECIAFCGDSDPKATEEILLKTGFSASESARWAEICDQLFLPEDHELGIFLQQEHYLEKEQHTAGDIPPDQRPLNQNWSWDRILRSCFIKQADVLQGLYFFEEHFDRETIRRNFLFYEPRTVHESSLSPCVHAIHAASLDMPEKAYELFLRTARLDLDDYNNDTGDGLHITSMAGTWMAVVKGFAGMRVHDGLLALRPALPAHWHSMVFLLTFRGHELRFLITHDAVTVTSESSGPVQIRINDEMLPITSRGDHVVSFDKN